MTTYVIEQHIGYVTDSQGSSKWWKQLETFEDQSLAELELYLLNQRLHCNYRLIITKS